MKSASTAEHDGSLFSFVGQPGVHVELWIGRRNG